MNKSAFLEGVTKALTSKFSDPKFVHGKAIPFLDRLLSHNTTSTLLGAGVGSAAAGAASLLAPRKKKSPSHFWRNTALGGLAGAGSGYLFSQFAPSASAKITDELLRKPFGRIMTNSWRPRAYVNSLGADTINSRGDSPLVDQETGKVRPAALAKQLLSSGVTDTPSPWMAKDESRMPLYRSSFNLPVRQDDRAGLQLIQPGSEPNEWVPNTSTQDGQQWLAKLLAPVTRNRQQVLEAVNRTGHWSSPGTDPELLANYVVNVKKSPETSELMATISDPWDFGLHTNESFADKGWLRYLLNRAINPQTVSVRAPLKLEP